MFFQRRIAPHFFEFIKFAGLSAHNVHHDVDVIDQHPLQILLSFMAVRDLSYRLFYRFFHRVGDGPNLGLVAGFADDKKVGNRFGNFAQVKRDDVLTLFILDGPDDGFVNF